MKVFYDFRQCATQDSLSPSAEKPRWVVEDWSARPELGVEIMAVEPASVDQLCRAHRRQFVEDVLSLRVDNGFENKLEQVARALPWTSGSLMSASRWALANKAGCCSPTSGFHHAQWDRAMGFCTFNGLMVAALAMRAERLCETVAILDCDAHYGNGTDDISRRSGGASWLTHRTMGATFQVGRCIDPGAFESWLDQAIADCSKADLVIYQAGADPHELDPYGGMLSSQRMAERDRRVFQAFKGKALVWNLAGGYQVDESKQFPERIEAVLALHRETARLHAQILSP